MHKFFCSFDLSAPIQCAAKPFQMFKLNACDALRVTKNEPIKMAILINKNQLNLSSIDNFKMNSIQFNLTLYMQVLNSNWIC